MCDTTYMRNLKTTTSTESRMLAAGGWRLGQGEDKSRNLQLGVTSRDAVDSMGHTREGPLGGVYRQPHFLSSALREENQGCIKRA